MVNRGERRETNYDSSLKNTEKERGEIMTRDVRLFLFQSKLPETLPTTETGVEGDLIAHLQFTEAFFARKKSQAGKPDRIVPIGGLVEDGESVQEASIRRVVEQTHVRPTTTSHTPLPTEQRYEYTSLSSGEKRVREVSYASARLLPRDKGYVLDTERNKIEEYVGFTIPEWESFLRDGEWVTKDGVKVVLSGNLLIGLCERDGAHTYTDDREVHGIHREFMSLFKLTEADKKFHIMNHLLVRGRRGLDRDVYDDLKRWMMRIADEFADRVRSIPKILREIDRGLHPEDMFDSCMEDILKYYEEVTKLWSSVATHYQMSDIREALGYSNLEAELSFATNERFSEVTGAGFPTIDLLLPILIGDKESLTFREKKILIKNPRARKLLKILSLMRKIYDQDPEMCPDKIIETMTKADFVRGSNNNNLIEISKKLDQYFDHLLFEKISAEDIDSSLRQDPEVLTYSEEDPQGAQILPRLIRLSFSSTTDERGRETRFEAQRKLVLLFMLCEGLIEKNKVIENGIIDIVSVEDAVLGIKAGTDKKEAFTATLQINGIDTDVQFIRFVRVKSDLELMRKMITRDMGIGYEGSDNSITNDTFGEALIISSGSDDLMEEVSILDLVHSNRSKNSENMVAPRVVRAYISKILEVAKIRGLNIQIVDFKPLNIEGQRFVSSSAGGGDVIRMLKFDIKHTTQMSDGTELNRFREVQMFLPKCSSDGSWLGGEVDFREKKLKDEKYGINRLFMTRDSIKSFIELIFPTEIYGDTAQKLYTGKIG